MAHLVATFTVRSGQVRMICDGLYERQTDGGALLAVGFQERSRVEIGGTA